jgi:cytochrome o ubiquinol oxidase subunit 1
MVIGGFLFGFFSALSYWFPKVTGFFLNERLSRIAFWFWFVGFLLAFMPLYMLGFMGATRRLDHYDAATGWNPLFQLVLVGACLIFIGICVQIYAFFYSVTRGRKHVDTTGDPWNGRSLEWSIPSPAPIYNFALPPVVDSVDPLWAIKRKEAPKNPHRYAPIHLPKDTPTAAYIGLFAFIFGFAMVWYIYWAAVLGALGVAALLIHHLSQPEKMQTFTVERIKEIEHKFGKQQI